MKSEFREFAVRGNVVDMAVGIIIGGAFATIARSLVEDIIMPPVGLILGGVDFKDFFAVLKSGTPPGPYVTIADAQASGAVTLNWGVFINNIVSFLIVAFAVFILVKAINRIRRAEVPVPEDPTTKVCEFCRLEVPVQATRCPNCTSELGSPGGVAPPPRA
ncbi:MAG: large-conductance mechanosensitive channel protein MscL [Acidobacteria bacterium]|nr:large-conductance mechanosensitive channel protein MscL [Acidobacteriota bacterium]